MNSPSDSAPTRSGPTRFLAIAPPILLLILFATIGVHPAPAEAARSEITDGLGVFTTPDAGSDKTATLAPGQSMFVFVKTDDLSAALRDGMQGAQFGVTVDPRLEVVARFPTVDNFLVFEPNPNEWIIAFQECTTIDTNPYTLITYQIRLPAGSGGETDLRVDVRDLTLTGEPMSYISCIVPELFTRFHDAGGVVINPSAPSIVHLSGSPPVMVEGRTHDLAWEVLGASAVQLDGNGVPAQDSVTLSPVVDTTYVLSASDGSSTASASWSLDVIREPRVDFFTAVPFVTETQTKVQLSWEVWGSTNRSIDGVSTPIFALGSTLVPLRNPPVWTFTATNEWGTTQVTAGLTSGNDPPFVTAFTASPNPFQSGDTVTLTYGLFNADGATITPDVGVVDPTAGSVQVTPTQSTTYTLTATNAHGSTSGDLLVQLLPPGIFAFNANPATIFAGQSTTLNWSVGAGLDLDIQPGVGPVFGITGSAVVTPPADNTVYTLTASNIEGSVSADAQVAWKVPDATLVASDETPFAIDTITLTATIQGADSASLEPGFGAIDPNGGSFDLVVEQPTTFTLTATNAKGDRVATVDVTPRVPVVSLAVSNPTPFPDEEIGFTVQIEGAASASLDPVVGAIPPADGEYLVTVPTATTVTLTGTNAAGSSTAQAVVNPKPPVIAQFEAQPTEVLPGQPATLTWSVSHADSIVIDPVGFHSTDLDGSAQVTPAATTTYTLRAFNTAGVTTAEATVNVAPVAITSFMADPSELLPGETSTLSWATQGATLVTIEPGGFSTTEASGTLEVDPPGTTTYTLTASNAQGSRTAEVTVTRIPFRIVSFTATPTSIDLGEQVTLSWEVVGQALVSIDNLGPQALVGSLTVMPTQSTSYTLRVTNGPIVETRSIFVTVGSVGAGSMVFSWEPDTYPGSPPALAPFVPFHVYVLSVDPANGIKGFETSVNIPFCLTVLARTLTPAALNVGSGNNFIVGLGACFQEPLLPLIEFLLGSFTSDFSCLENSVLSFEPSTPSSFVPATPGYLDCLGGLVPFNVGDPLPLVDGTGVPALVLDLSARGTAEGIELRWSLPVSEDPQRITVLRRLESEATPVSLAQLSGPGAVATGRWLDARAETDQSYAYRLVAEVDGQQYASDEVVAKRQASLGSIARSHLLRNRPNPFNPSTTLRYVLSAPGDATIELFDLSGRVVRTFRRSGLAAGEHTVVWNGRDESDRGVSSGVYVVRLSTATGHDTQRITLLK